jgi:hypothetical protein
VGWAGLEERVAADKRVQAGLCAESHWNSGSDRARLQAGRGLLNGLTLLQRRGNGCLQCKCQRVQNRRLGFSRFATP